MLGRAFRRTVLARRWLAFTVLCLSFALFGGGTVNLFNMFRLNLDLIAEHGLMALADGAAQQFLELLITLVLSMAGYIVFKSCEYRLVHGLTHAETEEEKS